MNKKYLNTFSFFSYLFTMMRNSEKWKKWSETKTDAFKYLLQYLFKYWGLNNENDFLGFSPDDLIFADYHSAIGITGRWQAKEVYSFSLSSELWFNGRVYNNNFQFYQEEKDLFIANCCIRLASNGIYCIYEDIVIHENVFV